MLDINVLESNRSMAIYAIVAAIVIALLVVFGVQWQAKQLVYSGSIGNITVSNAIALSATASNSPYVSISPKNNRIAFLSRNASVVVLNIDVSEAAALAYFNTTKYQGAGDVLVIDGLVYPTLVVPDNATLNVTFVNLDIDEDCGLFVSYTNPALALGASSAGLYAASTFKTPLIDALDSPNGVAEAAFSPNTQMGHFNTLWYLSSCSKNMTYGTLYNGAFYG
ncbi:MAG: hypothetical protein KGH66_03450 [Candidatus Micrarchaeota archaeon]|nr:hypothetical protein [Candidatus Micrarchaeota archaeon]